VVERASAIAREIVDAAGGLREDDGLADRGAGGEVESAGLPVVEPEAEEESDAGTEL
jgi:hypothetical protein